MTNPGRICVILFLFCAAFISVRAERLPIRVFTSADGLGSSFVDFLLHDSRGFMWFCTRDGLSRFDGTQFITYQVGAENAAPGIESIHETRGGIYWIVTTAGLYRFRADALSKPQPADLRRPVLNAEPVSPLRGYLFEDRDGNLFICADKLYKIKDAADAKPEFSELKINLPDVPNQSFNYRDIRQTRDGSLWIKTTAGFVRRLPDERVIFYRYNKTVFESTVNFLEAADDRIWISVGRDLYVINPAPIESLNEFGAATAFTLEANAVMRLDSDKILLPEKPNEIFKYEDEGFLENHVAKFLFQTSDKKIWIGTARDLLQFDGSRFYRFGAEQGVLETRRMAEDAAGNLWLAGPKGLMRLDRKGLITFKETDGLQSSLIHNVLEGADGKIYTSQGNHLLGQFDGGKFQTVSLKVKSDSRVLWASRPALRTRSGEWWIASQDGVFRFPAVSDFKELENREPLAFYDKNSVLKGAGGFQFFEDSRGDIWIGTRGTTEAHEGLARFSPQTGEFYIFTAADNYPKGKAPASFAEDKNGNLWVSFYQGGIARYSNGKFTEFAEQDGFPPALIGDLLVDRRGRLWVASTRAGLIRIDDPQAAKLELVFYNTSNGLASNNVRTITEDFFGNIYVGTVRGVDKLSPETNRVRHYSVADGLAGDFVVDSLCDRGGTIWFATMDGLSKLSPLPDENKTAPPAWISGLSIDGLARPVAELGSILIDKIDLAPTENNLQIDFFGLNFNPSETLRYQYMLEGADKDWSAPTESRKVSYANLTPGSYRFLVRSVTADGAASERPAVVSFVINPPFYQQRWFIALVIAVVGGLIFALDRYRVAKTHQVENALKLSRESETRFRTLAETASDAILTIDEESRILFVNPALETIFGYTAEEMVGEKLTILMPEDFRPKHEAGFARYLSTRRKNIPWNGVELPGKHKSGAHVPLEVSFGEFERDGRRYFTGIIRDISERKHAEEALRRAREERLRELERVRTRIATDLHDDIGASLTQISILTEVARSQAVLETVKSPLERISAVSNELVEAMSDIVWAINPRKDNLRDLVQRMRRFASDVLSARGIKFVFHAPDFENNLQLGANIRRELFAVFKECVNNIARHSGARLAEIDFHVDRDSLRLSISDNGNGFEMDIILSSEFSPEKGGNGLINMRRRAEELGGSCDIISFPGGGTSIIFWIPTHAVEELKTPAHTGGENGNGRGLN